jgi:hypothetical protein
MAYDEITEKQLKNIKRKLVAWVWEASTKKIIEVCLILGISLPKNLLNKFASKDFDSES